MANNKLTLTALPFAYNALEPIISEKIVTLHHDKHQAAYVNGVNAALEKIGKIRLGEIEGNLREVMRDYSFNYNGVILHEMCWQFMNSPKENNLPSEELNKIIEKHFGSFEKFKKEFNVVATTVEGSGWATLWQDKDGNLLIGQLEKHNLLGINEAKILLVIDVWEHAYYLDYVNNRAEYVEKWWQLVNWDMVFEKLNKRYE